MRKTGKLQFEYKRIPAVWRSDSIQTAHSQINDGWRLVSVVPAERNVQVDMFFERATRAL